MNLPNVFFKAFLGTIRNSDITALAAFSIVNKMEFDTIKMILEVVNAEKRNNLNSGTYLKIQKKIAMINQKIVKYMDDLGMWEVTTVMEFLETGKDSIPLESPNYYSFDLINGYCKKVNGERLDVYQKNGRNKKDTVNQLINTFNVGGNINRLRFSTRNEFNSIDIQEANLREVGGMNIRIMNGESIVKKIAFMINNRGEMVMTI